MNLIPGEEVCKIFNITKNTLYALNHDGGLVAYKHGRKLFYDKDYVNEIYELNNTVKPELQELYYKLMEIDKNVSKLSRLCFYMFGGHPKSWKNFWSKHIWINYPKIRWRIKSTKQYIVWFKKDELIEKYKKLKEFDFAVNRYYMLRNGTIVKIKTVNRYGIYPISGESDKTMFAWTIFGEYYRYGESEFDIVKGPL